jgi:hypothetical protein
MNTIYENKFGNVIINVSDKNLILSLSGGFDSAVLLYMLAKTITDTGSESTIWPITVRKVGNGENNFYYDKANPYPVVEGIIAYVRKKFPLVDIRDTTQGDVTNWWNDNDTGKPYVDAQKALVDKLLTIIAAEFPKSTPITYTGVTKNPNIVVGEERFTTTDEFGNVTTIHRNPERHRDFDGFPVVENTASVIYAHTDAVHYDSFRNADKRVTMLFASRFGILDDLLTITRSCEGRRAITNNFTTTCQGSSKCWWCYEREWALENYDK